MTKRNRTIQHDIYAFAARMGVGIGEACDRAGIARSTPPRWSNGTEPRPAQVTKMRKAVIDIARERGAVIHESEELPVDDLSAAVMADLTIIREAADRIEATLAMAKPAA